MAHIVLKLMALTRRRGNALATRQRRVIDRMIDRTYKYWTLARPEWVTTPVRENQKNQKTRKYSIMQNFYCHTYPLRFTKWLYLHRKIP